MCCISEMITLMKIILPYYLISATLCNINFGKQLKWVFMSIP